MCKPLITRCRQRNPNNLLTLPMSANTLLSFSIGFWNCQSAVNKADFITSITSHSRLNLMALTETWIKPEDTAIAAALSNNSTFCFSLTSCLDSFCPLSSKPVRATPSAPWLSDVLRKHCSKLRAAERVWRKSRTPTDLNLY